MGTEHGGEHGAGVPEAETATESSVPTRAKTPVKTRATPPKRTSVRTPLKAPSSQRSYALLERLGVVLAVVTLAAGAVWLTNRAGTPDASPTTTDIPALDVPAADVQPGAAAPVDATVAGDTPTSTGRPQAQQAQSQQKAAPLSVWADRVADVTGIPARALVAYGNAELRLRASDPSCHISWPTLAGIGRIESDHGQYGGAVLQADGYPSRPIIGVPLDGTPGVQAIPDTDHGRFDGDPDFDHAVGPMQFIPSTWAKWGGGYNPQQIDAAALAAAKYLCAGGRDMSGAQGWWAGVLSYNNSVDYARKVFGLADSYAKAAQVVRVS
jgi:membrane-bound lytic murein transglycosylase B